jgi:hypothetical protein
MKTPSRSHLAIVALAAVVVAALGVMALAVVELNSRDSRPSLIEALETATPAGPTPIPWIDSTKAPTTTPTTFPTVDPADEAVRQCTADDLVGAVTGENAYTGGELAQYITIADVSRDACRVDTPLTVYLLSESDSVLSTAETCQNASFETCRPMAAVLQPAAPVPTFGEPSSAGQAEFELDFQTLHFFASTATPCPESASLALGLPGGNQLNIPVHIPVCGSPSINSFRPGATPKPQLPPPISVTLDLPDRVASGSTLRFTARVKNTSQESFRFEDSCPNYVVLVFAGPQSTGQWHSLNCSDVSEILPGQEVSFLMEATIPDSTPSGRYPVTWTLEGTWYFVDAGISSPLEKTPYWIDVLSAGGASATPTPSP